MGREVLKSCFRRSFHGRRSHSSWLKYFRQFLVEDALLVHEAGNFEVHRFLVDPELQGKRQ